MVRRELEKLVDYLHPSASVSAADVESVRGADTGGTVWDFLGALARKDRGNALRALGKILDAGEPPLRLLGLLAYQWRQVWKHFLRKLMVKAKALIEPRAMCQCQTCIGKAMLEGIDDMMLTATVVIQRL